MSVVVGVFLISSFFVTHSLIFPSLAFVVFFPFFFSRLVRTTLKNKGNIKLDLSPNLAEVPASLNDQEWALLHCGQLAFQKT